MTVYPWKRFWCPRETAYSLADGGYLYDPDGPDGPQFNPSIAPLAAFAECPCLVMLGEPGIGKSHEFDSEFARSENLAVAAGNVAVRIDLKEYQTDGRLVAEAFENDIIRTWQVNNTILNLFFDSLDEGRLEIHNIASILASQFRRLTPHIDRLRLRITCRTAEWPSSLERTLVEHWGESAVEVIELAPLRRKDIVAAADTESVASSRFLENVAAKDLQSFAMNPITLKFLLDIHRNAGALPSTKQQLYEDGCRRLCEETSKSRLDAGHYGNLTSAQRMEIAARIAALSIFCGRSTVFTFQSASDPESLTVADLAGGKEWSQDDSFEVSENAVREVLQTTLFSGRGPNRLGFAHRTYAEFLSARYVSGRSLDQTQLASLIFHSEYQTRIVPQLSETAAWIAIADNDILNRMMSGDPQILLRSDVATAHDAVKETLVTRLVKGLQSDELDDSDWELHGHYRKLAHPRLAAQLEPILRDKGQSIVTRRFVADIAEQCHETNLLNALADVALDQSDDSDIRAAASHAIIKLGTDSVCERLRPLAMGKAGPDPEDELRGNALQMLWERRLIAAAELFENLTHPQRRSFFGSYKSFLHYDLTRHLLAGDLEIALRWCIEQRHMRGGMNELEDIVVEILRLSLNSIDSPPVLDAFADYFVSRIQQHAELQVDPTLLEALNVSVRRRIIEAVVPRLEDPKKHLYSLMIGRRALIHTDDLSWLFEKCASASSEVEQRQWSEIARNRFLQGDRAQLDHVLECCASNPMAAIVFADLFEPVVLDSPEARAARAEYARYQEIENTSRESRQPPLLAVAPKELVQACLNRFESGDLNAWWQLNRQLQLEPHSTHYLYDSQDDLTSFPGWIEADEPTRHRILEAGKDYLTKWRSQPDEWVGTAKIYFPDFSGYRAMVLLEREEPSFLESLNSSHWENFAPVILAFPTLGKELAAESTQIRLVSTAYKHAPETVIETLLKLIIAENARSSWDHLFVLRRIIGCWDERMIRAILGKAQDESMKPSTVGYLIEGLLNHHSSDGLAHAKLIVSGRVNDRTDKIARHVAAVLWMEMITAAWDILWPEFIGDRTFFRDVMSDIAHERLQWRSPPTALSEAQLADLYILLSQEFPHDKDAREDGAYHVTPLHSVAKYREQVLAHLCGLATPAACNAIERIQATLPHVGYLSWALRSARRATMQATWIPISVQQFRELTERRSARLVRNEHELQQVIMESLARLQRRMQGETPAVRDVWDHNRDSDAWEPVDENALSDYFARHLREDLKACGIVALREVEIRRGNDGKGERTDIYVAAVIVRSLPETLATVRVIVEVKGCWHSELKTAMKSQLRDRYLEENDCEHGIYMVGWFSCESWNRGDSRRGKSPKWMIEKAREFFEEQQRVLSTDTAQLSSFVMDLSLK